MTPARRFLVPGLLAGETRAEDLAPEVAVELLEELGPLVGQLALRALAINQASPVRVAQPPDQLLTVRAAAARLGVSVEWVYRHAAKLGARRLTHPRAADPRVRPRPLRERKAELTGYASKSSFARMKTKHIGRPPRTDNPVRMQIRLAGAVRRWLRIQAALEERDQGDIITEALDDYRKRKAVRRGKV